MGLRSLRIMAAYLELFRIRWTWFGVAIPPPHPLPTPPSRYFTHCNELVFKKIRNTYVPVPVVNTKLKVLLWFLLSNFWFEGNVNFLQCSPHDTCLWREITENSKRWLSKFGITAKYSYSIIDIFSSVPGTEPEAPKLCFWCVIVSL